VIESGFIRSVHDKLPKHVYSWKIHDKFTSGIPDCWYRGSQGRYLFVEYKYITLPKRPSTIVLVSSFLSQLQIDWLTESHAAGINVAVVVGTKSKCHLFFKGLEWEAPLTRADFDKGLTTSEIAKSIEEEVCKS
jgi:hypothetical protein